MRMAGEASSSEVSRALAGSDRSPFDVLDVNGKALTELPKVTLHKGWNRITLRIVHTGSRPLATYAVVHSKPQTPPQPSAHRP